MPLFLRLWWQLCTTMLRSACLFSADLRLNGNVCSSSASLCWVSLFYRQTSSVNKSSFSEQAWSLFWPRTIGFHTSVAPFSSAHVCCFLVQILLAAFSRSISFFSWCWWAFRLIKLRYWICDETQSNSNWFGWDWWKVLRSKLNCLHRLKAWR